MVYQAWSVFWHILCDGLFQVINLILFFFVNGAVKTLKRHLNSFLNNIRRMSLTFIQTHFVHFFQILTTHAYNDRDMSKVSAGLVCSARL